MRSFLDAGVPFPQTEAFAHGTNLKRFNQVGSPNPLRFDVLFVGDMSLQKRRALLAASLSAS